MASKKQIDANRRNSLQSTGPKSDAGKATSSMNALKSGLHAKSLVLPTEKAADLELLTAEYYGQFHPETAELRDLVDEYITLVWQLRRLALTEVALYKHEQDGFWQPENVKHPQGQIASNSYRAFAALQRRLDSTRRSRDRVRDSIHRLRAAAPARAAQPEPPAATGPAITQVPGAPVAGQPPSNRHTIVAANPLTPKRLAVNWLRSATSQAEPPKPPAPGTSGAELALPLVPQRES